MSTWIQTLLIGIASSIFEYYADKLGTSAESILSEYKKVKAAEKAAATYQTVVDDKTKTREERKDAEDSALNS